MGNKTEKDLIGLEICSSCSIYIVQTTECQKNVGKWNIWESCLIQGYNARIVFPWCTYILYCSVLSLGSNVNTRRMSKPDMGSIFHNINQWHILDIGNYYVNYQNYQNSMLLTSSDTKLALRHLFLFINSAQRELVSICTQSIRNCN